VIDRLCWAPPVTPGHHWHAVTLQVARAMYVNLVFDERALCGRRLLGRGPADLVNRVEDLYLAAACPRCLRHRDVRRVCPDLRDLAVDDVPL
jgi:hypothetical protein